MMSTFVFADHDPQAPACLDRLKHEDYVAANRICEPLAEAGDAQALFAMGRIHGEGLGRTVNQLNAVKYFNLSLSEGYRPAAYPLGVAYELGRGVAQDLPRAVSYYRQAAADQLPEAQFKLGQLLLKGQGVKQDLDLGQRWIRLAARAGHQDAQVTLAILLAETDPAASLALYQQAAEQESADALYNLAAIYFNGDKVAADLPLALEYAQRSKVAGHDKALVLYNAIFDRVMNLHGVTAAGKPATADFASPGLKKPSWLFDQPQENFVLQLAQFKDEQSMAEFFDEYQLADKVDYYRSVTVLGPVYVVLFRNQFASYSDAKQGLAEQLPDGVSKGGWIRQVSVLQNIYTPVDAEKHAAL